MSKYRRNLPQLSPGKIFISDGGVKTTLVFHDGVDLPHFAAFTLLKNEAGRALLRKKFADYADIARRRGAFTGFATDCRGPPIPNWWIGWLSNPITYSKSLIVSKYLADGVGFEPTKDLRPCRISSPVHSTALPPIHRFLTRRASEGRARSGTPPIDFRAGRAHLSTRARSAWSA
jgi:hypothetical protein